MTQPATSARLYAKREGLNIQLLMDILSYWRPYNTVSEMTFIEQFVDTIPGMLKDECGNRMIDIPNEDGTPSHVMWSCHTDTVHAPTGCNEVRRQNLLWDATGNIVGLHNGKAGQCLGADDGAGMWLLMQMIEAKKPGLYIFHRGEEKGGIGSRWIEKNTPDLLENIQIAMAFDRRALTSVITHQRGTRCCSDDFGVSLANELGLGYKLDTTGSFTDTAVYTDLVAECTNVSCGYYSEHGPRETLDVGHLIRLREKLLALDVSKLVIKRTAGDNESLYSSGYGGYYGGGTGTVWRRQNDASRTGAAAWGADNSEDYEAYWESVLGDAPTGNESEEVEEDTPKASKSLVSLVTRWPEIAADLLEMAGFNQFDFADEILDRHKMTKDEETTLYEHFAASDEEKAIECNNCFSKVRIEDAIEDEICPFCYADLEQILKDQGYIKEDRPLMDDIEEARCA